MTRNYRLNTGRATAGCYLQGVNEATHGIADSLLTVLAVRAADITRDILADRARPRRNGFPGTGSPATDACSRPTCLTLERHMEIRRLDRASIGPENSHVQRLVPWAPLNAPFEGAWCVIRPAHRSRTLTTSTRSSSPSGRGGTGVGG